METVEIPRAEYDALVAAKEELDDIKAYDRALAEGGEGLPHEFMLRLLDGESPLAVFRQWRGLSQAALAKHSGVSRVQIIDIEAGRAAGSVATVKRLAVALDVAVDDIV